MATIFFLESVGNPEVNPAANPNPTVSANFDRRVMGTTKLGTAMTSKAATGSSYIDHRMYVSAKLSANTTFNSGVTVKLRIKAQSSGTSTFLVVSLKVVSADGLTVRGYMADPAEMGANAFATTAGGVCRSFSFTCNTVNALQNERIVLEIMHQSSSSRTATFWYGSDSASNLPDNQTETQFFNPTLEFSNTFSLQESVAAPTVRNLMMMGIGK